MIKPDRHTINQFIKEGRNCEKALQTARDWDACGKSDIGDIHRKMAASCSSYAFLLAKIHAGS